MHNLCRAWADALDNFKYTALFVDETVTEVKDELHKKLMHHLQHDYPELTDFDAYVAVGGVRANESLKYLAPESTLTCRIPAGGDNPPLTIECDRLVPGQTIGYEADLTGGSGVAGGGVRGRQRYDLRGTVASMELFSPDGRSVGSWGNISSRNELMGVRQWPHGCMITPGIYICRIGKGGGNPPIRRLVVQ